MENKALPAITVVEAKNICFSYPADNRKLIENINLIIRPGELIGMTGKSGVGKSTLADLLLNLKTPDKGKIYWHGQELSSLSRQDRQKQRLRPSPRFQKIFQDPAASFPPRQKIQQAMADVVSYYRLAETPPERELLIEKSLPLLGLAPELLHRYPHQLSGGEMQRMSMARVMLVNPCFVVADEPTSRLDLSVQAMIIHLLADLVQSQQWAVLLISHDNDLVKAVCKQGWRLEPGRNTSAGAGLTRIF